MLLESNAKLPVDFFKLVQYPQPKNPFWPRYLIASSIV
jgi:hypothetical protein